MSTNMLEFDEGYDAYEFDEPFDPNKSSSWQDGYLQAQQDDCGGAC